MLRRDGIEGCLAPAAGLGHWEMQGGSECARCVGYEEMVTACLRSSFTFACVRIEDQELRNDLERRLIACVAQCTKCQPSARWLGLRTYPENVRSSGLWNSNHVNGPCTTDADIKTFRELAQQSDPADDLSDTLLLIPCSAGKKGARRVPLPPRSIADVLGPQAAGDLADGRSETFNRARLDPASERVPAVLRYSGQPYATVGVVDGLLNAIMRGLHVLIVSGGYGVVRAEEPIQYYEAQMKQTLSIWRPRFPIILRDYVEQNRIARTFGTFSREYANAVPDHLSAEDWRAVPNYRDLDSPPVRAVPKRVAENVLEFLAERHNQPGNDWVRT